MEDPTAWANRQGYGMTEMSPVSHMMPLGRGGSYQINRPDGDTEAAVGFSLYPNPLIDAGFGAQLRDQIFLPVGHDRAAAARLRDAGWRTVAALSGKDQAQALGCTHILNGDQPEPL